MSINLINLRDSETGFYTQSSLQLFLKKSFEAINNWLIDSEYTSKGLTLDFDFDLEYFSQGKINQFSSFSLIQKC